MTISYSTRLGVPIWSDDNDTFTRLELDQGFTSMEAKVATTGEGPVGGRPAFGPGGAFYLATDQGVLYYDTGSAWVIAGRVVIGTQVVQPAAQQAASLTEWRNASGSVLAKVNVDGSLAVDKVRFATASLNNLTPIANLLGMTNYGGSYSAFGYRTTIDGWCEIQGTLATNGSTGGATLTAPDAVPRPNDGTVHTYPAIYGAGSAVPSTTYINVFPNGALVVGPMPATGGYLALDGIRYYVGG